MTSVPEYLSSLPPVQARTLKSVLSMVRKAAPGAELMPDANAKGNLAFPLDATMPAALIGRVAKALAKHYARPGKPKSRSSGRRARTTS